MNKVNNRTCADCTNKNPRWVSITLGVFVCIRCCGVHRNLGTHISKMKSVTLDKWQPDWVRIFDQLDNEVANRYWERNLPAGHRKPNESSTSFEVESFIRDKYEFKRWIADGEPDPVTAVLTGKARPQKQEPPQEVKVKEVTAQPVQMVDLLAVEPLAAPKPEQVLDWAAPSISFPSTVQKPVVQSSQPVMQPAVSQPMVQPSVSQPTVTPTAPKPPVTQPVFQQPARPAPLPSQDLTRESNIRNIMSMYNNQPTGQVSAPQSAFIPLGAIAAEQMLRGKPGYAQSYPQQWPSF